MSDETTRAAAERVRMSNAYCGNPSCNERQLEVFTPDLDWCPICHEQHPPANHPSRSDLKLLADAYLSEHPADDAELIDGEWLRSVGFGKLSETMVALIIPSHNGNGESVRVYLHSDHPELSEPAGLLQGGDDEDHIVLTGKQMTTRGDVRRLCAALGLPLTPPSPTSTH